MLPSSHGGKLLVETSEVANATRHAFQVHLVGGTAFHATSVKKNAARAPLIRGKGVTSEPPEDDR